MVSRGHFIMNLLPRNAGTESKTIAATHSTSKYLEAPQSTLVKNNKKNHRTIWARFLIFNLELPPSQRKRFLLLLYSVSIAN